MIQSILLLLALIVTLTVMNYANKQIIQGGVNIADVRVTQCFRGIAIMLVIMQHCAGGLGTNIFTPMGGSSCSNVLTIVWIWFNRILQEERYQWICQRSIE